MKFFTNSTTLPLFPYIAEVGGGPNKSPQRSAALDVVGQKLFGPVFLASRLLLLLIFFTGLAGRASAQFLVAYPNPAQDVSMCVNSTLLTVRVDVVNTSTGTTVAVDLPPGVTYTPGTVAQTGGTIVGITESNITNLNIPVFSIGDVGVGQFIAFTIQRTASDCAARAYVLGGGVMKDVVTVSGSAGSTTESNPTVNTYNLLYPALAITPPPPTINALRGGIYTRSGTATNGGTGCANAVHFFIVYPSGKIQNVGNKVTVGGVDFPASGTNGDTLFFELTGSIFGGDNLLCNGESFTYTVTEKILDCSMGAASLTPQYNAAWGCPGPSRCQTASATAPYTMQNGVPATSITFAIITPEAGCTPGTHDATITNTGSGGQAGALYGILTNFLEGSNSSVAFSLSNFRIGAIPLTAVGIVGTLHSKSIDFSQLTTDPDGMGVGLEDIDGDGQYDDLMPGQSFTVRFDRSYIVQPLCVYGYAQLVSVQPTYFSMCGATRVAPSATTHTASYFFSSSGAISLLTPPSVTPGTPFTLQICRNGNSNPPTTRVTDSTEIILVLPPDLAYVPGTAFVQKTTGTGTMEVSQSGNILTLYTKGVNTIACYTFDLVYTCGAGGTLSIPYTFQYVLDRACNAVEQYRCSNITTLTSCPAPCTILGPSIGSVNIQRTTLGWTDGTLATKISPASMTTLSKKTVMPLDSFRVTTSARINAPAGGYDNLYFEYRLGRPLANQNAVEFRYGTVRFKPAGSPTVTATCTLPVISYAASTSTLEVMRFDFSSLLGSCLPATLMTGDSVFLDATFQVMAVGAPTGTLFGYTRIQAPNSYMEFYNLDAMGNRLVCVGAIPDLLFLGLTLAIGSESVNATGCGTRGTGTTVNLQFDEINNPFPTEFRPSLHEDSIIITLPTGFAFDMTQPFRYFYGRWTNPIVHSRLPVTIPPAMITQLAPNKIKIDNTANLLPYNQLGSQFGVAAVYHNVVPTCNAPSAALTPLHQAYQDWFYYSDAPVSGLRQNIQVSTWSYNSATKPALTLQNLTGTVQGVSPVQQWTVRISNPSPQTAPYVWLAIEDAPNGSGIDVVSVMDGATPLTPISYANGKWYQVSAAGLASGATKDLVINFTYAGCLPQQINAMTGWDCPGFPANPTAYMCGAPTMTVPLGVDPQPSEIQLTLDQQPAAPVTACTPFQYLLTINSAQAANLTNTKFGINLPTGLVMSGALEAEYPKGSGNWQVIANSGTATNLLFDLSTHAQYPSSGLPGTVLSPGTANRQICLRFNVETTCAFSPGNIFDFTVYADRPCGGAAIGNGVITTSSAINIAGITAPYLTGSVNNAPSPVVGCGVEQIINVTTTIVGGTTGANDHIVVTFPTGTTYTGTFNCSGGNCPTVVGYSGNVLTLSIPTGVGAGTSIAYGFGIAGSGYAGCGAARKLRIQTTTELVGPTCNGVPCGNVSANTGSLDIDLDISKPSFTMSGFTATAQVPISGTTIMYQTNIQTITNTSATANAPAGTILEFFCLDGSGNPLGTPIGTAVLPAVPAGGTTSVMTNFSASCSLTNGIGVVIQDVTDPAAPAPGTPNMVQCLCAESARLAASLLNCFAIANGNPATQTVCQGTSPSAVTFATQNAVTNGIRFVGFAAPTADPYTGGTNLGTATGNGTDVTLSTAMMPTAVGTHYIYAIQDPVPSDPTCRPAGLAQLTINPAATVTAGSPQSICAGGTVTLAGTLGGAATSAVWSAPSGSFGNANSLTSTYMPSITSGSVMLTLTTDDPAGVCPAVASTVVITVDVTPTTAAAGPDQNLCLATSLNATLAANTPSVGTGAWSVVSGPSTLASQFSSMSANTAIFTPAGGAGIYTLRWTISNGSCTPSTDDVAVAFAALPTAAAAGSDQNVCLVSPATLSANAPSVGTGTWNVVSGPSTSASQFSSTSANNATFTPTGGAGTYTLRWTVSNAPCPASTDDVAITVTPAPTVSAAGPDQSVCLAAGNVTLAANTPSVGTGAWSVVSGPSTLASQFSGTSANNATFTPAGGVGTYTLRWTVSNAPCAASTDDVAITFTAALAPTSAGSDQNVCITAGNVTLSANAPSVGTGAWSVVSGPSTASSQFSSTSANNATFTPTGGAGTYTLRWTVSNAPCPASTDDVAITFTASPTTANAGPDQNVCATTPNVALAANAPAVGTGAWSVVSGPSTLASQFSGTSANNATFTPAGGVGTYTLRWTVSNAPCAASTDDVAIVFTATPTASAAGPDQNVCIAAGNVTLAANAPSAGTGAWSVVSGPSTASSQFSSTSANNATFTPTGGAGTYTLRWTVSNAPCPASTDDVAITFTASPTTANAGPDQNVCATTPNVALAANAPAVGTGAWSVVSGPSTLASQFSGTSANNATFTPAGGVGTYTLRWTVSNAPCAASTDDVAIVFTATPTASAAGPDQTACISAANVALAANAPVVGTGAWSVASGPSTLASQFSNTALRNAIFTPAGGPGVYTLRWTVSNAPCPASVDDVQVTFVAVPTATSAGPDQNGCPFNPFSLSANTPLAGTGSWSIAAGPNLSLAQFSGTASPNAIFTPATPGVYTLRWTIVNPPCTDSQDDVVLTATDAVPPVPTCVTPIVRNTDSGVCSANVALAPPSVSDNCSFPAPTVSQISGPTNGSAFPKGTSVVVWRAMDATGNSSTCSVVVTVVDVEAPMIICPANIIRPTDPGICGTAIAYTAAQVTDNCPGATSSLFSGPASGATLAPGTHTVVLRASDASIPANTAQCSFTITVVDTQSPTITCPPNQSVGTNPNTCAATVTYPKPTATDNCALPAGQPTWVGGGSGTVTNLTTATATFNPGVTTVVWKATDAAGLSKTCSFRIIVSDAQAPTITCPTIAPVNAAQGTCSAVITYANATATDNCTANPVVTRIKGAVSGSAFAVGTSRLIFRATDAAGRTSSCSVLVTVVDNQPPVISCPGNITVTGNGIPCRAVINYSPATGSDNCDGTLTPFQVQGLASGSVFPAGMTTNTWRARASNGQETDCSFTVTINNCPSVSGGSVESRDALAVTRQAGLRLAPNPADDRAMAVVKGVDAEGGRLLLFDVAGRLVWEQKLPPVEGEQQVELPVGAMQQGAYQVVLRTSKETMAKPLIVVH